MPTNGFINMVKSQWGPIPYPTQSYKDKTVIVTGSNTGLGLESARHFARLGATKVILACRSISKGEAAARDITSSLKLKENVVEVWEIDMANWDSIKKFVKRAEGLERLDVVVENAGIARSEFVLTEEGWESGVAVNVIGTFLLALNLLPILRKSTQRSGEIGRIVVLTSGVHAWTNLEERKAPNIFEELNKNDPKNMLNRYSTTKLLEVLFVRSLTAHISSGPHSHEKVIILTLDPGLCHSDLTRSTAGWRGWYIYFFKMVMARTAEVGGRLQVLAAGMGEEANGGYVSDGRLAETSAFVRSEEGERTGERVYGELMGILEGIQGGIGGNV